jgi:hypothetical protein
MSVSSCGVSDINPRFRPEKRPESTNKAATIEICMYIGK